MPDFLNLIKMQSQVDGPDASFNKFQELANSTDNGSFADTEYGKQLDPNRSQSEGAVYGADNSDYLQGEYLSDPNLDVDEMRSYRQGWFNKVGSGVARAGIKIGTETAKIPGILGGIVAATYGNAKDSITGRDDTDFFETAFNNSWINAIENFEEETVKKDMLPVYTSKAYKDGNLWDAISSVDFWATEGADGIGFMASMMLPGAGLKALGAGRGLANLTGKIGKTVGKIGSNADEAAKIFNKVGKVLPMTEQSANTMLATTANTIIEAGVETGSAMDRFEDQKEPFIQKRIGELIISERPSIEKMIEEGATPEEVEERLLQTANNDFTERKSELAAKMFSGNAALLLLPNYIQSKFMYGATGKLAKKDIIDKAGKFITDGVTKTGKQKAFDFFKGAGGQIASEGFMEEGGQMTMENTFFDQAMNNKAWTDMPDLLGGYVDMLGSVDGQKAIFLGGLLGTGMSQIQARNESKATEKMRQELATLYAGQTDLMSLSFDSMFKKDENGQMITKKDADGNDIVDEKTGESQYEVQDLEVLKQASTIQELGKYLHIIEQFDQLSEDEVTPEMELDYKRAKKFKSDFQDNMLVDYISHFAKQGDLGIEVLTAKLRNDAELKEKVEKNTSLIGSDNKSEDAVDKIIDKAKEIQADIELHQDYFNASMKVKSTQLDDSQKKFVKDTWFNDYVKLRATKRITEQRLAELEDKYAKIEGTEENENMVSDYLSLSQEDRLNDEILEEAKQKAEAANEIYKNAAKLNDDYLGKDITAKEDLKAARKQREKARREYKKEEKRINTLRYNVGKEINLELAFYAKQIEAYKSDIENIKKNYDKRYTDKDGLKRHTKNIERILKLQEEAEKEFEDVLKKQKEEAKKEADRKQQRDDNAANLANEADNAKPDVPTSETPINNNSETSLFKFESFNALLKMIDETPTIIDGVKIVPFDINDKTKKSFVYILKPDSVSDQGANKIYVTVQDESTIKIAFVKETVTEKGELTNVDEISSFLVKSKPPTANVPKTESDTNTYTESDGVKNDNANNSLNDDTSKKEDEGQKIAKDAKVVLSKLYTDELAITYMENGENHIGDKVTLSINEDFDKNDPNNANAVQALKLITSDRELSAIDKNFIIKNLIVNVTLPNGGKTILQYSNKQDKDISTRELKINLLESYINGNKTIETEIAFQKGGQINLVNKDGTKREKDAISFEPALNKLFDELGNSNIRSIEPNINEAKIMISDGNGILKDLNGKSVAGYLIKKEFSGSMFIMIKKANGEDFPLKLNQRRVNKIEAEIVFSIIKELSSKETAYESKLQDLFNSGIFAEDQVEYIKEELKSLGLTAADTRLQTLFSNLVYKGKVGTGSYIKINGAGNQGKVTLSDKLNIDATKLDERKEDIINHLMTTKNRQISKEGLLKKAYRARMFNDVLTTDININKDQGAPFENAAVYLNPKPGKSNTNTPSQSTATNQSDEQKVKELRDEEQTELKRMFPNAELNSDGKINVDKLSKKEKIAYDKVYDRYDKPISRLLKNNKSSTPKATSEVTPLDQSNNKSTKDKLAGLKRRSRNVKDKNADSSSDVNKPEDC
mgnify:CR=1 FL=1|tara:strand:+ start:3986 stop:8710 length:4725 start_codon:yes stop_codon:yes gene_type:complete